MSPRLDDGFGNPSIVHVTPDGVSVPALVGICLGTTLFLVSVAAVTCLCYRRRSPYHQKLGGYSRKVPEKPVTILRPTAVRSPGVNSHYLKKSPSPTGNKSPPGSKRSSHHLLSPEEGAKCLKSSDSPLPTPKGVLSPQSDGVNIVKYVVENETAPSAKSSSTCTTPVASKAEVETPEVTVESAEVKAEEESRLGMLHFKLKYNCEKSALVVTMVKCCNLPSRDLNSGTSDPYVKLQLLPDKQHKVKTRVLRKSLNPVYDEDFTFYGIDQSKLEEITLHFVVLSFDRYSRDDIIGEVLCPMSVLEMPHTNEPVEFSREITPRSLKIRSQGRGELLVSLCHQPAANRLTVVVLKARRLPKMDISGLSDPYVKIYLLFNGQRMAKKKTHVKKRTLNPVFNESFVFELPSGAESLENVSLEMLLLDWDRVTKNEVIGRLELGGPRAAGAAAHHWKSVCSSPRRQIAEWHKLRE